MPYNRELDDRINVIIADWGTTRKKMFGGTCNLVNGNMMCGVYKDYLTLRLGEGAGKAALLRPHTKPFDITGKPMKGWIMGRRISFPARNPAIPPHPAGRRRRHLREPLWN